jgi:hypothetical protein
MMLVTRMALMGQYCNGYSSSSKLKYSKKELKICFKSPSLDGRIDTSSCHLGHEYLLDTVLFLVVE